MGGGGRPHRPPLWIRHCIPVVPAQWTFVISDTKLDVFTICLRVPLLRGDTSETNRTCGRQSNLRLFSVCVTGVCWCLAVPSWCTTCSNSTASSALSFFILSEPQSSVKRMNLHSFSRGLVSADFGWTVNFVIMCTGLQNRSISQSVKQSIYLYINQQNLYTAQYKIWTK